MTNLTMSSNDDPSNKDIMSNTDNSFTSSLNQAHTKAREAKTGKSTYNNNDVVPGYNTYGPKDQRTPQPGYNNNDASNQTAVTLASHLLQLQENDPNTNNVKAIRKEMQMRVQLPYRNRYHQ
jgi:hypothetical protein